MLKKVIERKNNKINKNRIIKVLIKQLMKIFYFILKVVVFIFILNLILLKAGILNAYQLNKYKIIVDVNKAIT